MWDIDLTYNFVFNACIKKTGCNSYGKDEAPDMRKVVAKGLSQLDRR